MRWTRWSAAGSMLAAAVLAGCANQTPQAETPAAVDPVQRGEYLVNIAGCNDCHTPGMLYGSPDYSRRLAGTEMGWAGPWGVVYAANLTPDPETGLGDWTAEQIAHALKTGVRPNGTTISPAMPWMNSAMMTDEDRMAVAAYLKSLPPISHQVPAMVPPEKAKGVPAVTMPPPSAWDAPKAPPGGAPPQ